MLERSDDLLEGAELGDFTDPFDAHLSLALALPASRWRFGLENAPLPELPKLLW